MGVYVVASTVTPMSGLQLAAASQEVARVVGAQDNPEDVGASAAIQQVLKNLNGRRWNYLLVRGSDIELFDYRTRTAGQEGFEGQYTMPTPFLDLVSAKLKAQSADVGGRPLELVNRGSYDRAVRGSTGLGTWSICFFPFGQTAKAELLDWPEASAWLEVRYFRPIDIPYSATTPLDVPKDSPLEGAVIHLAKEIVAVDAGDLRKARYHGELGRAALTEALRSDLWRLEDDTEWQLPDIWARYRSTSKRYSGYGRMTPDGWTWE